MNYLKDSLEEIKKVTWPTKNHAIKVTVITIVFTAISTLIITGLDFGFREAYDKATDYSPKVQRDRADQATQMQNQVQVDPSALNLTDSEGNPVNVNVVDSAATTPTE